MSALTYPLAVLPAVLIAFFIYQLDRNDRETHRSLLICFVLGMLMTIPVIQIESLETYLPHQGTQLTLGSLFFSTFVLVALVEEVFKLLPLLLFAFPRKYFSEPFDGIVFAVMIAMGFALIENIFYAYQLGWQTTLVRAFTAVPAHGALAVIMGHYVGRAKFDPERRWALIGWGLIQVIVIHGLYDIFIIQDYNENLMAITALVLTLSLYYAIHLIRRHGETSIPVAPETDGEMPIVEEEKNEIAEAIFLEMSRDEEE